MRGLFFPVLIALCAAPLYSADFDEIADELLGGKEGGNLEIFRGHNIALVSGSDPVSADFAVVFQNKLKAADCTIVFTDQKIIQKEIDRQMSGIVDDEEVTAIGHEKGANIVIQIIICRISGSDKIKFMMTAAFVETNTLAASGIAVADLNRPYDRMARELPLQNEDAAALTRKKTLAIVEGKAGAVYDDPVPVKKDGGQAEFKLPEFSFFEDTYWGVHLGWLGYWGKSDDFSENTGWIHSFRIGAEWGKLGGWGIGGRICLSASFLVLESGDLGFDINAGCNIFSWNFAAAAGFSMIPNNIEGMSAFVPYIEIRLSAIANFSLRFAFLNPHFGMTAGAGYHRAF